MQEVKEEIITVILAPFNISLAKCNILMEKSICFSPKLSVLVCGFKIWGTVLSLAFCFLGDGRRLLRLRVGFQVCLL